MQSTWLESSHHGKHSNSRTSGHETCQNQQSEDNIDSFDYWNLKSFYTLGIKGSHTYTQLGSPLEDKYIKTVDEQCKKNNSNDNINIVVLIMLHLAYLICRDQNVPCCQVSVDKGLTRQIGHTRGNLSAITQEGVVIHTDHSLLFPIWPCAFQVSPQISLREQLQN